MPDMPNIPNMPNEKSARLKWLLAGAGVAIFVSVLTFIFLSHPPSDFPEYSIVSIPPKTSLTETTNILKNNNIIRSEIVFKVATIVVGGRQSVKSGDYLFDKSIGTFDVAKRLILGDQGLTRAKVTFPEGSTVKEMGKVLSKAIFGFDEKRFVAEASQHEGYIFPDTYFFFPNVTVDEVIRVTRAEFNEKIAPLQSQIKTSGHSLSDIIIMASILEKEGVDDVSRRIISGILWKRMKSGMRLQIDSTFAYTIGKSSLDLTVKDLATDSKYNTYLNDGLPGGPIGNPGISAIDAAINPTPSPYFFFLSDDKNVFYYARTFAEHVLNKQKYLK